MDHTEFKEVLFNRLKKGLPVVERPFAELGREFGVGEEEVLAGVRELIEEGVILRLGAIVNPLYLGFGASALAALKVPDGELERVAEYLSRFEEVAHCYHRKPIPGWEYNLYITVHSPDEESILKLLEGLPIEDKQLFFIQEDLLAGLVEKASTPTNTEEKRGD